MGVARSHHFQSTAHAPRPRRLPHLVTSGTLQQKVIQIQEVNRVSHTETVAPVIGVLCNPSVIPVLMPPVPPT